MSCPTPPPPRPEHVFASLVDGRVSPPASRRQVVEIDADELADLRDAALLLDIAAEIVQGLTGMAFERHLAALNDHAYDLATRRRRRRVAAQAQAQQKTPPAPGGDRRRL